MYDSPNGLGSNEGKESAMNTSSIQIQFNVLTSIAGAQIVGGNGGEGQKDDLADAA